MSVNNIKVALLILITLPIFAFLYYRYKPNTFRKKACYYLRLVVIILIIISFMGISLSLNSKDAATVFLADYSKSTELSNSDAEEFIETAVKSLGEHDLYSVVSFADKSVVEKSMNDVKADLQLRPSFDANFTDIESALEKASYILKPDAKKRVVLMTDGRENAGDMRKAIRYFKEKNIGLDVYPIGIKDFDEVEIDGISLPKSGKKSQNVQLETKILSNVDTGGEIYLYCGSELVEKKPIDIKAGTNAYIFSAALNKGGIVEYRVNIVPDKDTYMENNTLSSFIDVEDKLKILIVQNANAGVNFASIFSDFNVDIVSSTEAPSKLETLMSYDAFIMADVSLEDLNYEFVDSIEKLVKEQGKGLIVSGGENSFALGGYHNTKLEEMLPLTMDVKDKEKEENLAMVLAIDKSGSMAGGNFGVQNIDLAKEAATRATEILTPKDYLGVLVFDGAAKWVFKLEKVENKQKMQNLIGTIRAAGGTSILPALSEAVSALLQNDAAIKHIILLTDGQAENRGYAPLIKAMNENKITLSTVAVGEGADKKLMKMLAESGNGRYYESNIFTDIPTIFAKEAVLAGKKYLNHVDFFPSVKDASEFMDGIGGLPQLSGYVACTEKPLAKVALVGPDDDPILASFNYGLGKTVAFTSDMAGLWSNHWLNWEENQRLWRNILGYVLNTELSTQFEMNCEYKMGYANINLEFADPSAIKTSKLNGKITTPSGKDISIDLEPSKPGTYSAKFKAEKDGIYFANFSYNEGNESSENESSANETGGETGGAQGSASIGESAHFTSAFVVPYSDEFRFIGGTGMSPEEIAELSGGRLLTDAKEVFSGELPNVSTTYDLSKIFLVLALLLFLIELVFRMTGLKINLPKIPFIEKMKARRKPEVIRKNNEGFSAASSSAGGKSKSKPKRQSVKKQKEEKAKKEQSDYLDSLLGD